MPNLVNQMGEVVERSLFDKIHERMKPFRHSFYIEFRKGESTFGHRYVGELKWFRKASVITILLATREDKDGKVEEKIWELDSRLDGFALDIQKKNERVKIRIRCREDPLKKLNFKLVGEMNDHEIDTKHGTFDAIIHDYDILSSNVVGLAIIDAGRRKRKAQPADGKVKEEQEATILSIHKEYVDN